MVGKPGAVESMLYLLDEAFEGRGIEESNESQALMPNLQSVTDAEWLTLPPGATRTVESMVRHVAGCKVMYADYAFGPGTKQWGTPEADGAWAEGNAPIDEAIGWLREAHRSFRTHVEGLSDDELDGDRMTNWGELRPTRWIIAAIVGHDFYHAGEINHLRSLLGTDDRWRWQQLTDPGGTEPATGS